VEPGCWKETWRSSLGWSNYCDRHSMTTHQDIAQSMNAADATLHETNEVALRWYGEVVARIREQCKQIGHIWRWHEGSSRRPRGMYCVVCDESHGDN
jgi:hypothetical protein